MAEIIHDGFDWLAAASRPMSLPKWDEGTPNIGQGGGVNEFPASRGAHRSIGAFASAGGYWLEKIFPGNRARIFEGRAISVTATGSTLPIVQAIGSLFDGTSYQITLTTEMDYSLGLRRGDVDGTLIQKTAANTLSHGLAWEWFEFEYVIHGSAGVWRIWKEGALLNAFTGLNTQSTGHAYATKYRIGHTTGGGTGGNSNYWVASTDLYVIDDQPGNGPTDRVGDSSMYILFPNAAGASTDFTPSTGANWENVDEAPSTEDTNYNEASTVGNKDRYGFQNLPSDFTGNVVSVTHGYRLRKTDAGSRTARGAVRSGSSEVADTTHTLTTDYQSFAHTIWADPATTTLFSAMSPSAAKTVVDALQAGPEIIA